MTLRRCVRFSERRCVSASQLKTAQIGWWSRRRTHLKTLHEHSVSMRKNCNSDAVAEEMAISGGEIYPEIQQWLSNQKNCILGLRDNTFRYGEQLYWVGEWWTC